MKKTLLYFITIFLAINLSASPLDKLREEINKSISQNHIAGIAICVGDLNGIKFSYAQGMSEKNGNTPMTADTIIDVASVTKSVATTTALAILRDRGEIDFDKPFNKYLPQYSPKLENPPTIRDIATHISGFNNSPYWNDCNGTAMVKTALSTRPPMQPRKIYKYSCWNFILLGFLVENITQQPLKIFCQNEIFKPLGMKDTSMGTPIANAENRCARTITTSKAGEISDPPARAIYASNLCSGNAGLFTTANDLSKFCRMILGKGKLGNTRILSEERVKELSKITFKDDNGNARTFGWNASTRPKNFSDKFIYHTGWSGQSVYIDLEKNIFAIVLTVRCSQYPNPSRERKTFAELAIEAMFEQNN